MRHSLKLQLNNNQRTHITHDDDDEDDDDEEADEWAQGTLSKTKKHGKFNSEYISTKWILCETCEVDRKY